MSESTKTILWIGLAVIIVIAVVVVTLLVVRTSRRRRELDERRFQAVDLRAQAQQQTPVVQERADRASVTEQIAADARAVADEKVAAATMLEHKARVQRAAAEGAEAERDELAREADRIDPDVDTDEAGHRIGDVDTRSEDSAHDDTAHDDTAHDDTAHDDTADNTLPSDVAGRDRGEHVKETSSGVLAGASTLDDHDDEPDLADADDPFAAGGNQPSAERYDATMEQTNSIDDTGNTDSSDSNGATVVGGADGVGSRPTSRQRDSATEDSATEDSATEDSATEDSARDHAVTGDAAPVDDATAAAEGSGHVSSEPAEVSVPALADRDEVLVGGGPPTNDPGDHRGQPWATTPGEPGLDEGDDLADNTNEGFAAHPPADAAPEHDTAPDADPGTDDDEAHHRNPANNSKDDDGDRGPARDGDLSADDDQVGDPTPAEEELADEKPAVTEPHESAVDRTDRRLSTFDEVVDGGFGIGSAQPIDDGAQPLGHAVKGWRDRKSFVGPGEAGYDDGEPDVWFFNEDAARRAGFSREGENAG